MKYAPQCVWQKPYFLEVLCVNIERKVLITPSLVGGRNYVDFSTRTFHYGLTRS